MAKKRSKSGPSRPQVSERNIRVTGHRRAFEVGRFVLAVMVHAEALAEGQSGVDVELEARDRTDGPTSEPRTKDSGVLWQRDEDATTPSSSSNDDDNSQSEERAA